MSQRLAGVNKLLLPLAGRTVLHRTVSAYVAAGLDPVVVVVGYEAQEVRDAVHDLPVQCLSNPEYELGQSRGLVRGVSSLRSDIGAAVIGVGDQPLLTTDTISEIVIAYSRGASVVVPRYAGRRGNPVLFARSLFEELLAVQGDVGGREVVQRHANEITWVDVEDAELGADIDTPEQYASILDRLSR